MGKMVSATPSYEETLANLFDAWKVLRVLGRPAEDLLRETGCRQLIMRADGWNIEASGKPAAFDGDIAFQMLLRLLREGIGHVDRVDSDLFFMLDAEWGAPFALLDGLARDNRWRICLENENDAYRFAQLLLYFDPFTAELARTNAADDVKTTVHSVMREVLSDWLNLDMATGVYPSTDTLARAMFGDAWCDIVMSSAKPGPERFVVGRERPPFLPGLLPGDAEPTPRGLPDLG